MISERLLKFSLNNHLVSKKIIQISFSCPPPTRRSEINFPLFLFALSFRTKVELRNRQKFLPHTTIIAFSEK